MWWQQGPPSPRRSPFALTQALSCASQGLCTHVDALTSCLSFVHTLQMATPWPLGLRSPKRLSGAHMEEAGPCRRTVPRRRLVQALEVGAGPFPQGRGLWSPTGGLEGAPPQSRWAWSLGLVGEGHSGEGPAKIPTGSPWPGSKSDMAIERNSGN